MERDVVEQVRENYQPHDIELIQYKSGNLLIEIETNIQPIQVNVTSPVGYRVLDEGDLLEFWETCTLNHGWLYKILEGGWRDLESTREGFLSGLQAEAAEWFLVTQNTCVSIISYEIPVVKYK